MAATNFTSAINALVAERDRVFLVQVAADYNIPYEELQAKYLETAEKAIKVPRKYTKKPTAVTVVTEGGEAAPVKAPKAPKEKQCCTAQTSKKDACKFSALKGEVFCKRHLKQSLGEPAGEKVKVPKVKVPKVKPLDPVHTHAIGTDSNGTCDLCHTNGNALIEEPETFELSPAHHTGPIKQLSAAERLAAILADTDDEEDEAEAVAAPETDGEALSEEDYDDEE